MVLIQGILRANTALVESIGAILRADTHTAIITKITDIITDTITIDMIAEEIMVIMTMAIITEEITVIMTIEDMTITATEIIVITIIIALIIKAVTSIVH